MPLLRVRLKNKGSKKRPGRQRQKYQASVPEHPQTVHEVTQQEIHANHVEAFNASMRRRTATFRRKTNTHAKSTANLQRTLDVFWLVHNFVRVHFSRFRPKVTGDVPLLDSKPEPIRTLRANKPELNLLARPPLDKSDSLRRLQPVQSSYHPKTELSHVSTSELAPADHPLNLCPATSG
jgi:hypothetical protein